MWTGSLVVRPVISQVNSCYLSSTFKGKDEKRCMITGDLNDVLLSFGWWNFKCYVFQTSSETWRSAFVPIQRRNKSKHINNHKCHSVLEPCSSSKPCSYDLTDCTHEAHCSKTQVLMNDDDDCLGNMVYPSEDVAYRAEHPGQIRGPFLLTGFLQTTLKCLSVSFQS